MAWDQIISAVCVCLSGAGGFWAGCDFSKFRVREAEKREKVAKQEQDALQQWLNVAHEARTEMRGVADAVIAQRDAADLAIDRILDVIHDAREKQAEVSEASTSGQ
jgi:hypothetical protein